MPLGAAAVLAAGLLAPAGAGAATVAYSTPGPAEFSVPSNVTEVTLDVVGGGGGISPNSDPCAPGKGADVHATVAVAPGATLSLGVAGRGGDGVGATGGAAGIGGGGAGASALDEGSGGGGGASTVAFGTTPLIVAAGGGGCGTFTNGGASTGGNGGNAGADGIASEGGGGGRGTASAGGAGGASVNMLDPAGQAGTAGQGGAGVASASQNGGGGGGGGGYFGGGAGGGVRSGEGTAGGGGGGSNFAAPGLAVTTGLASTVGDGRVTISYTPRPAPSATTRPALAVGVNSATVAGLVDPQGLTTTYLFDFGPTARYSLATIPRTVSAAMTSGTVTAPLSGLAAGSVFHYRLRAMSTGGTSVGVDQTFRTKRAVAKVPSTRSVLAALGGVLVPTGSAARIAKLLSRSRYTFSFRAPSAGSFALAWFFVPKGARVARAKTAPKPVLVASVSARVKAAGRRKLTIRLTKSGRGRLAHVRRLKLTARARFKATGGHRITRLKTFTLRR